MKIEEKKEPLWTFQFPILSTPTAAPLLYYHFVVSPSVIVCRQVGHWTIFHPRKRNFPLVLFFIFKKNKFPFFGFSYWFFIFIFSFVVAHFSLYDLHPRTICTSPPTSNKPRPPTFFGAPSAVFWIKFLDFCPFFPLVLLFASGTTPHLLLPIFPLFFWKHRKEIFGNMNGERGLGAAQFGIGGSGNSANNTSASGSSTSNNNNYQKPFNYHCCASSSGYQNIGRVQVYLFIHLILIDSI